MIASPKHIKKVTAAKPTARGLHDRLTPMTGRVIRLPLPAGSFNAGLVTLPHSDNLICVYRPDENRFTACLLSPNLEIIPNSHTPLDLNHICADPRLIWHNHQLLMVYSSINNNIECVRAGVIMDLNTPGFMTPRTFQISQPSPTRQKNWTPFTYGGKIHLIAAARPHEIYRLDDFSDYACSLVSRQDWACPWYDPQFLRGNTNPVQLDDSNWLGTFHTVQVCGRTHYYDNGCYVFGVAPPFRVVRCSYRTWMRAEDAVEPHFRKRGEIQVGFPVGMVRQGQRLLISYGDNDSAVKILDTTVDALLSTTLDVTPYPGVSYASDH